MPLKSNHVIANERFHSSIELNNGGGGLVTKLCATLVTPWTSSLLCPWDSPGKNTGVGYHFHLQGTFPT